MDLLFNVIDKEMERKYAGKTLLYLYGYLYICGVFWELQYLVLIYKNIYIHLLRHKIIMKLKYIFVYNINIYKIEGESTKYTVVAPAVQIIIEEEYIELFGTGSNDETFYRYWNEIGWRMQRRHQMHRV